MGLAETDRLIVLVAYLSLVGGCILHVRTEKWQHGEPSLTSLPPFESNRAP